MRRHFIYQVSSSVPSPAGRGTTEEWLEFYKLHAEGETYIRMSYDGTPAVPRDVLWFQVDRRILACVPIQNVQADCNNGGVEFWYQGMDVHRLHGIQSPPQHGALPALLGDQWLRFLSEPLLARVGGV